MPGTAPLSKSHQTTKENVKMSYDKTAACRFLTLPSRKVTLASPGNRGFTLMELILVVAIIALLAAMAWPLYSNIKDKARSAICMTEIRDMEKTVYSYSIDKGGGFPDLLSDAIKTGTTDPWGNQYTYNNLVTNPAKARKDDITGSPLNTDFDLYSNGPDGVTTDLAAPNWADSVCQDDITRSGDGGFVGIAGNIFQ